MSVERRRGDGRVVGVVVAAAEEGATVTVTAKRALAGGSERRVPPNLVGRGLGAAVVGKDAQRGAELPAGREGDSSRRRGS